MTDGPCPLFVTVCGVCLFGMCAQGRRNGDSPGGGCKMKILPTEWAWQLIEFHFMNLYVKFADMPVFSVLSLNVNKLQKVTYPASLKM